MEYDQKQNSYLEGFICEQFAYLPSFGNISEYFGYERVVRNSAQQLINGFRRNRLYGVLWREQL